MDSILAHIRAHMKLPPRKRDTLNALRNSQWSRLFEQLMRNRLIMGAMRYETLQEKRDNNHGYNLIASAKDRLTLYEKTGNMEHLVDAANLCMIEFDTPTHRSPNWETVDDGSHVTKKK